MPPSLPRLPFSRFFRQLEQDMETVVKVLQPGPLGIIQHKFTPEEIKMANATVAKAVENWQRAIAACGEQDSPTLEGFIDKQRFPASTNMN
ncbi:uncharacterized protein LOC127265452 [Andrographis paniculata]|uniref:uncharacterized protein LOC127265452 n=1 Tax=Andrographis paniculata TaxID=175694 RepID=UPI0021E73EE9|nr:uncharacterized protein LOC127265452 [Andrographis paniculata]